MSQPLMKCGCVASGVLHHGEPAEKPVCVAHLGLIDGADQIAPEPDLVGRIAICTYCKASEKSSLDLPFFVHNAGKPTDTYYNGCRGWD